MLKIKYTYFFIIFFFHQNEKTDFNICAVIRSKQKPTSLKYGNVCLSNNDSMNA